MPSVAEEDARRLHRERDRLVSERVQHVNRIKGLCALQGIYGYNPLRPQAMARLEQLRTAQGGALPPRLKSEIKRELQRLELVVEMIATLEAERNTIVADEASTHVNAKKIQTLHKLKAIGPGIFGGVAVKSSVRPRQGQRSETVRKFQFGTKVASQ